MATLLRRDRSQCGAGDSRGQPDGGDAFARRIQSDLDAAYAPDQNASDRPCRQLRLDAPGSSLGLYPDFLCHDHSASGRDADVCRQGAGEMSMAAGHGASVRIESCGKTFADGTRALESATLDIARGETLVLLRPSGCGKTTMLRIIAGLELPDAGGRGLFDDKDMTSVPIEKRNVGMVFQSYALFPNMSVADNIGYGVKIRGMARQERAARVAELVVLTNITGLEKRRVDQLSGGQRQRVALARAVAIRPGILLLDEPLTALDAALRDRLRGELNRLLRALGITTIYVTHDQSEAMELGDRIVVMQKGAMAQIGTPREIYFKPKNRFVAEFIGAANIIEAPLENGHLVLPGGGQPIGGDTRLPAAVAMVRPETIRVIEAGSAPLSGTIDSVSFIGDRQRMIVSGASSKSLTVDAPNAITAKAGERIGLLIAPDAVRLLPPEN